MMNWTIGFLSSCLLGLGKLGLASNAWYKVSNHMECLGGLFKISLYMSLYREK